MTLEQLEKFSGNKIAGISFTQKPFAIDKWRVATDGYILIAENGFSPIKLPQLEACSNRDKIAQYLAKEIPQTLYSVEHLFGFLGDEESELPDPMMFNGYRVDRSKLRKVFTMCDEPYRFTVEKTDWAHSVYFAFGKTVAIVMGMREPQADDPRYEPKPVKTVSR